MLVADARRAREVLGWTPRHSLRDIVSTAGPLGYLAIPQDIGNNLALGLAFQTVVWVSVLAIVWGFIYRSGVPLRNLIFFTAFLALSDGSEEALDPATLTVDGAGVLRARVRGGRLEARLASSAAAALAEWITEVDGRPLLRLAGRSYALPPRSAK